MKLSFGDLIVPAILLGAGGWWGYNTWSDRAEKNHAKQVHQAESAEYRHSIDAMIMRHAATPALTDKLAQESHVYTYHVQNALLAATGRAVIVKATIVDMEKRGDGYVLVLDDAASASPAIRYILECDAGMAQKIIGLRPAMLDLTLAAAIPAVERIEVANAANLPGSFVSAASAGADRFLAKGRCLEFVVR